MGTIEEPSRSVQERTDAAKSLFGILPADITLEEAREERLDQIQETITQK